MKAWKWIINPSLIVGCPRKSGEPGSSKDPMRFLPRCTPSWSVQCAGSLQEAKGWEPSGQGDLTTLQKSLELCY
ncbi:hypothetical protein CDAR_526221 [Caerostris darwini]|uniref:Uncharacterized protein n=1 Tax=Caerostris darwini TaxID=1538125 RepID=A0AAV4UHN1_9ARAC|nr:hypothetical protein CDAR_526221 [Caerostris darwini]